jgi:hypothetical protein
VEVELEKAEQAEILIELPEGAEVKGALVGAKVAGGSKVYLQELPSFAGVSTSGARAYIGPDDVPQSATDVDESGAFRFRGVSLASYMLMLLQPSPPRQGPPLRIEIEPFRVRKDGIDRQFDLSEDLPGVLRGRIGFEAAQIPMDRLLVVARRHLGPQQAIFSGLSIRYPGQRSFVRPSGEFAVVVTPGKYLLDVVDVATSLRLNSSAEAIEVEAGGNESYDTGAGVTLQAGQKEFELVVPPGEVLLLARNDAASLEAESAGRPNSAPLGRCEVTVEQGRSGELELTVEPPAKTQPKNEDADAANVDR